MPPETVSHIFTCFFKGLDDYTVNERGDVGSWVRIACVKGLCEMIQAIVTKSHKIDEYLSVKHYHTAIAGILKQGVERLDNVRQCAGEAFITLLNLPPPTIIDGGTFVKEDWTVRDRTLFSEILEAPPTAQWNDGTWLYPRAARFLGVDQYRTQVLKGLVLSIGSRTGSTVS